MSGVCRDWKRRFEKPLKGFKLQTHHEIVEWCMHTLLPGLTLNPADFSLRSYTVQEAAREDPCPLKKRRRRS